MKKMGKGLLIVAIVSVIASGVVLYETFQRVKETADAMYQPLPPMPQLAAITPIPNNTGKPAAGHSQEETQPEVEEKPISLLLFGVDKREGDKGRTDALLFLALHPQKKQTLMFSIPRDTRTRIADSGAMDKINHAFASGGAASTVATVQQLLDTPIHYYVQVDMEGFTKVVDTFGGITVDNSFPFFYEGYSFPKGALHLDGDMALAYVRMRYDDPQGDIGRTKRQQQVVSELMKQARQISTVSKLDTLLETAGGSLKTNLTFADMREMLFSYRKALEQIEYLEMEGSGAMIDGVYYYIVPEAEQLKMKQSIEQFMQMQPSTDDATGRDIQPASSEKGTEMPQLM